MSTCSIYSAILKHAMLREAACGERLQRPALAFFGERAGLVRGDGRERLEGGRGGGGGW